MKCEWKGCREEATRALRVSVPAQDWPIDMHQPARLILSLKCCLEHARAFNAKEFLQENPKLKEVFRIMLRGKQPPDFDRAFSEAIGLDDPELAILERQAAGST